jgi:WhiB family redox-sensing transcriptional regulator
MSLTTRRPTTDAADWRALASCAEVDGELFFPVGDNDAARAQAAQAKKVCAGCPVQETCLSWALEHRQDTGVWGGLTEEERGRIHQRRGEGYWARRRNVADHIYETRVEEFQALVDQGLDPQQIATEMGTNVQTVNRVLDRLAADRTAGQEVAV